MSFCSLFPELTLAQLPLHSLSCLSPDVTLMFALLSHGPLLNARATLTSLPRSTPRLKGSLSKMPPLHPETAARSIHQLCLTNMGEGISPYTPCCLPSEGSSPRRKGTAEGTGAELSVCYQKVSVIGTANRDQVAWLMKASQPLGHEGCRQSQKSHTHPFLMISSDSFRLRSILQG